ncbi:MAG: SDR family oxidoreductase [Actinomycetia bacterium]|nr:SDR family oxidoreductase [Actinomycetes bacterium]
MDLNLADRTAMITGASKGIGLGCARALASEGVNVVLVSRSGDVLDTVARSIEAEFGVATRTHAVDLADSGARAELAEAEPELDILVNNAGAIPAGALDQIDDDTWREAWDLKVFGYVDLCRRYLPRFEAAGAGVIVNVIGVGGQRPQPTYIAGAAGNAGLMAFSVALGSRSLRHGVRVVAVNPGLIITDRLGDMLRRRALDELGDAARWEELIPSEPAPGTVEQVADVVTFLASDRASHVSGTILTVDGGAAAR